MSHPHPYPIPLDDSHLAQINDALEKMKAVEYNMDLAHRAGIDMGAMKQATQELKTKLIGIKQTYFPGRV